MSNPDLSAKYEQERLRAHEQSQIVYLQGQIDELRRLLKDQTNKYNWAMEQVRKTEGAVAQMQGLFDRHTEDVVLQVETIRREVLNLRREISGALVKVEEGVKPIREMQAQIQQVAEARKQDRDFVSGWFVRIEQTEVQISSLLSQIKELDERQRQYVLQLDRLREADSAAIQEARRVGDELQIEKQALRRQAVESQQLVTDVRNEIEKYIARVTRLEEIRQQIDLFAETLPAQITNIESKLPDINTEIKRVERISTERFLMSQERLEELRQQSEDRLSALAETDEQQLRQVTAWLERIDGWLRELEQRLSRAASRIDSNQQVNQQRIIELERREIDSITAILDAFRTRAELVRAAQLEVRGED